LDTNVLIALGWDTHEHHRRALNWFRTVDDFATCALTQLGFLRISMNLPDCAADFPSARAALGTVMRNPAHSFVVCDLDQSILPPSIRGHGQITDLYLGALAEAKGMRLASLEKSVFHRTVFVVPHL
jgi:predicted nucleic acid-binding protein